MTVDPKIVEEIAGEVVLQFVLDGDLRVSPLGVDDLSRELATAMHQELLPASKEAMPRRGTARREPERAADTVSLVERVLSVLHRSPHVQQVHSGDAKLLRKIQMVLRLLAATALLPAEGHESPRSGGSGSPPPGAGPASGGPAEARVWARPAPPRPPPEDLDRRKRRRGKK